MAQTGYTPISLYYSTTAAATPTAGNLANGELAINITDGKLFYKDNGGVVQTIATKAAVTNVSSFSAGTTGFTPSTATTGAVTLAGTLATTNGGTGLTSFTANGVVYASSTSALATGSALTFDGTNLVTTGTATATRFIPSGSTVATNGMYLPAANSVGISTNSTNAVYIDSSQNVGIGTSSPTTKLNVSGGLAVQGTVGSFPTSGQGWEITGESATACAMQAYNRTAASWLDAKWYAGTHIWLTNGSERARIDSSGNLLVGTTSAGGKLTVQTASQTAVYAQTTAGTNAPIYSYVGYASSTATPALRCVKYDNNSTTSQVFVQFAINQDGANNGQINANGASAAAFGTYSDERLKENIVNLPSQLSNICALRPVEFDYKDGSGHQIGFIAQEMQAVYPDVVAPNDNEMLMVTGWSKTEARLVKAIQELNAKVQALESQLAAKG